MMALLYAFGLACSIWLILSEPTGTFFFAWGIAFAILNTVGLLRSAGQR